MFSYNVQHNDLNLNFKYVGHDFENVLFFGFFFVCIQLFEIFLMNLMLKMVEFENF